MAQDNDKIKQQRDRFLAFAFASADVFLEVSPDGKITFAVGATKSLTGSDGASLIGKDWLEFFAPEEHATLIEAKDNATIGKRCAPIILNLDPKFSDRKGIITGIAMPESESFFTTLSFTSVEMEKAAEISDPDHAITTGFKAEDENEDSLTTGFKAEDETADSLTTGFTPEEEEAQGLTTGFEAGKDDTKGPEIEHIENEKEESDSDTTEPQKTKEDKIKEFKSVIDRVDFDIQFQPIVDLNTLKADHYEVLSRFKLGDTKEWVNFGENNDMAPSFDLAVVERTMNFIHYKAGMTREKFSVNLSSQSIESPDFYESLIEQLEKRDYAHRILFEIMDSSEAIKSKKVSAFIQKLKSVGYNIALDNFIPDQTSCAALEKLNVDFVKISETITKDISTAENHKTDINNLVETCKNMETKIIAKCIESQEQADFLIKSGIHFAQGFLFGKAETKPSYVPPV